MFVELNLLCGSLPRTSLQTMFPGELMFSILFLCLFFNKQVVLV